ncbi:MAG: metallophosphoesterase [Bacteroidota bacterium]
MRLRFLSFIILIIVSGNLLGQSVPKIHSNIKSTPDGLAVERNGTLYTETKFDPYFTLKEARGKIKGTKEGLSFNFLRPGMSGKMYYGFIPQGDSKHPHPVYFKRTAKVEDGKTEVKIKGQLDGRYDMIKWAEKGYGTIGYRLVADDGTMLYDGKVTFTGTGPFKVAPTIIEGPFVNQVTPESVVITYTTSEKVSTSIKVGEKLHESKKGMVKHEMKIEGLEPATSYSYSVNVGPLSDTYELTTSPLPGARTEFVFAYASDSRAGNGGGERDLHGANFYIMKKIMALSKLEGVQFFQFSGDLINGYLTDKDEMNLQYANWKRAIEPFAHYFPVYVSMGNHEAYWKLFTKEGERGSFGVDSWPYETESSEAVFADNFSLPENGPESEDGASYDPTNKVDFPSYKENVFYYTYDNVAVVVLNSDYWYAPTTQAIPFVSGGMHGYIMDQQLAWFEKTISDLENNENIDHIFLTQHTPFFPNGGHVGDDMWYNGNNQRRPYVAGKPVSKGIIERRDQLLDIIVNKSEKVRAILTGDEHNYARTEVGPKTPIHPETFPGNMRVKLSRTIYQINNGAAGAPYYAQETTPWSDFVSGFTTQNALVLFHVKGKDIQVRVMNPDTLEEIETYSLTE